MPVTVLVVTLVFAVPTLILGVRRVVPARRWDQRRRPLRRDELVDRVVLSALRGGLLLLLLVVAVVAAVGSVAALTADRPLPQGVVVSCGAAVGLALLSLLTFARPRR